MSLREEHRAPDGLFKTVIARHVTPTMGTEVLRDCSAAYEEHVEHDEAQQTLAVVVDEFYAPAPASYSLNEPVTAKKVPARIDALCRRHRTQIQPVAGLCLGRMTAEEYRKLEDDETFRHKVVYYRDRMWIPELGSSTEHERAAVAFTDLLRDALGGLVRSERVLAASGSAGFASPNGMMVQADGSWCDVSSRQEMRSAAEYREPVSTPCIVLEVGVCQPVKGSLGLLAKKNQWFAQFPSVQCVVLIKVDTASRRWKFLCSVWERSPLYPHGLLAYHQDFTNGEVCPLALPIHKYLKQKRMPDGIPRTVTIDLATIRRRFVRAPPM